MQPNMDTGDVAGTSAPGETSTQDNNDARPPIGRAASHDQSCVTARLKPQRRRSITRLLTARRLLGIASIIAGLLAWQLIGEFVVNNSLFLATPIQAFDSLVTLAGTGELGHNVLVSGQEFIIGLVLGSGVGIIIGLISGASSVANYVLSPWISAFYATPIVALAPLLILWFGLGIASKVAVVFALVVFTVAINTSAGVASTSVDLRELFVAFGANRTQTFVKVLFPSALPYILTGLRLAIGRGLIGVMVGELFGAEAGVGFMILNASQTFNMPVLFAGIILFAAGGIILTGLFGLIERHVVHWRGMGA